MGCGWRAAGLIPVPVLVLSAPMVLLAGVIPPGPVLLLAGPVLLLAGRLLLAGLVRSLFRTR
jgi:hypothetical protein